MGSSDDLIQSIKDDSRDRSEWESRSRSLQDHRLSKRMKNTLYINAPNFVDPIIDDNIRDSVSQEMSMMFSSRQLANFHGLTQQAVERKRDAETGFDSMLRMLLGWRKKMENALDNKRSIGFAILKQVENNKAYEKFIRVPNPAEGPEGVELVTVISTQKTLPDLQVVSPYDFIVPTATEDLSDAERICHVHRYSKRLFKELGEAQSWANIEEVSRSFADSDEDGSEDSAIDSHGIGKELMISRENTETNIDEIVVWEIYHYKNGRRWRTLVVPDRPKMPLKSVAWEWIDGTPRDWPFVQLRNENRELGFYDTRSDAELLLDNQKASTAYMNAKGYQLDYFAKPLFQGAKKGSQQARLNPGSFLPEGVTVVQMPQINSVFDFSSDGERAKAARRSGASQGGFAGGRQKGDDKTATQVNAEQINASRQTNVSATRDGDPMSQFYMMMWTWLQHNPIPLPMFENGETHGMMPVDVYQLQFIVQSSTNSQNSNPDFVLQQMMSLGPIMQASPFVRQDELMRIITDQINPQLTQRLVVNPEAMGPEGEPSINQQIQQLGQGLQQIMQALQQIGQGMEQQGKQIEALNEFAAALSEEEIAEAEEAEGAKRRGELEVA